MLGVGGYCGVDVDVVMVDVIIGTYHHQSCNHQPHLLQVMHPRQSYLDGLLACLCVAL